MLSGAIFASMSIFLRRLLPNAPWVIAAISGDQREVRTFRADLGEAEKDKAFAWIADRAGYQFRVLSGRPNRMLSTVPRIEHVAEIHAIGVRVSPDQAKALHSLSHPPAITFKYLDRFIAVWRFNKPVAPDRADEAEEMLASKFRGERLNFFIPIPKDACVETSTRATVDIKDIAALAPYAADDTELSAEDAPKQKSWVIAPVVQRKKITLIAGEPGEGKSQIALDFTMRVSRGIGLADHPAPEVGGTIVSEICFKSGWLAEIFILRLPLNHLVHFSQVVKNINNLISNILRFDADFLNGAITSEFHVRQKADQDVLGVDVKVPKIGGDTKCLFERFLGISRELGATFLI